MYIHTHVEASCTHWSVSNALYHVCTKCVYMHVHVVTNVSRRVDEMVVLPTTLWKYSMCVAETVIHVCICTCSVSHSEEGAELKKIKATKLCDCEDLRPVICCACMTCDTPTPGHPSTAGEAWYWLKCVLRIQHLGLKAVRGIRSCVLD